MAKSHRHKKLRRQEKSKTQLKGVKKLARAQNVVDPTLRVKKIVIPGQLAEGVEGQLATRKKQNLQEILSALNHHNSNMKKDALAGLQELALSHSKILTHHFDKIVEKLAFLTSDLDATVRRDNLKVAEAVFQRVNENQMEPFWNLVLTHLKCTLTHLRAAVRYNTLPFLFLLVNYFPTLISRSLTMILPSLLELISSPKIASTPTGTSSSASTPDKLRLNVEISGRHSEVRERLKVFSLIGACLQLTKTTEAISKRLSEISAAAAEENAFVGFSSKVRKSVSATDAGTQISTAGSRSYEIDGGSLKCGSLSLYYPFGYDFYSNGAEPYGLKSGDDGMDDSADILNCSSNPASKVEQEGKVFWFGFIQSCLSVLTQTWVETSESCESGRRESSTNSSEGGKRKSVDNKMDVSIVGSFEPQQNGSSSSYSTTRKSKNRHGTPNILNQSAADSLSCILDVMFPLIMPKNDCPEKVTVFMASFDEDFESYLQSLRKSHGADLKKYFFALLPYTAVSETLSRKVTTLNLKLLAIAGRLRLLDAELMLKFEEYIQGLISENILPDSEQCDLILKSLAFFKRQAETELPTTVICYILEATNYSSLLTTFLEKVLSLGNQGKDDKFLVDNLDWSRIAEKLLANIDEENIITYATLLSLISIRKASPELKVKLLQNTAKFNEILSENSPKPVWDSCIRLFRYSDAFDEFQSLFFDLLPQ